MQSKCSLVLSVKRQFLKSDDYNLSLYKTHDLFSAKLRQFLVEFHVKEGRRKDFKYARQLTCLAHREQVLLTIDLDDVGEFFTKVFMIC